MRKKMKGYKSIALMLSCVLCLALSGCSGKEKDKMQDTETRLTEAAPEVTGAVENAGNAEDAGNAGTVGNGEADGSGINTNVTGSELQEMTILAKADFNGDGVDDYICAKEVDKSGLMQDMRMVIKDDSEDISLQVPQTVTITCYQESGTEFTVSCNGLDLGTTTLDEKPAYGTLGHYLETTMGMEKEGNAYRYTISGSEFSLLDAECHGGYAIWCRGKFYVEGKEYAASWTQEYSLGKWVLTSMELPMWNVNGPNTGWGLGKGEMTETEKERCYVGYLDEAFCYRDKDILEDFDGDGTLDRIFRDRSDNVSYTIHFGNGKELLITDDAIGDWINWYVWQANEETTMFLFQESGSGTGGGWTILHLYMQTEDGLVPMELPEGPTLIAEVVSERQIALYRNEEKVATFHLDEGYTFRDLSVEEWLEWYTTEESGAHVLQISSYDEFHIMDDRIQWRTHMGDRWGAFCLAWDTKYVDGAWEIIDVMQR
ncbi:MAG: hypothetical protein E7268_04930 [Lachnospiraceae bacterium]|nr:hypothetical protein [Lachnospiraceae bacterium]